MIYFTNTCFLVFTFQIDNNFYFTVIFIPSIKTGISWIIVLSNLNKLIIILNFKIIVLEQFSHLNLQKNYSACRQLFFAIWYIIKPSTYLIKANALINVFKISLKSTCKVVIESFWNRSYKFLISQKKNRNYKLYISITCYWSMVLNHNYGYYRDSKCCYCFRWFLSRLKDIIVWFFRLSTNCSSMYAKNDR